MALFSLRTVTFRRTGFSPVVLIHGKNLRIRHTLVNENLMEKENLDQNVVDYILNLNNILKYCQGLACKKRKNIRKSKNSVMIGLRCIEISVLEIKY